MSILNIKDELTEQLRSIYLEILKREPDEEGLKHYLKLIMNGKQTVDNVRNSMYNSDEYQVLRDSTEKSHTVNTSSFLDKAPHFKSTFSEAEVKKSMNSVSWYHSIEINGMMPIDIRTSLQYQMWAAQNIPDDLSGKSVLDIGCADGFYSFLAESRGAKRVVAVDFMKWDGFDVAKKLLDSKVEHKILKVEHLEELKEKFDVIFFFGVYYHLANPVDALQKIFLKVNDGGNAFLAGHIVDSGESLMCYYDEFEMHPNDDSNWWAASPSCITQIAKRVGFKDAKLVDRLYQREMLSFQSDEAKSSIRRLGHIGVFEFIK